MVPLADTHVHLLAGLDDGPPDEGVAVAMCRMLVAEGVRHATALAHQNPGYPHNVPEPMVASAAALSAALAAQNVPLRLYPTGEVMLAPTTSTEWIEGKLLSVGNHRQWLLVEMPHGMFVDLLPLVEDLRPHGVRLVIAHAERYAELLDDRALTAKWIAAGCLIQATARMIAEPWDAEMERGLKAWAKGGFIHVLGSDGHGLDRRTPVMAAGYRRLASWVGDQAAERIGCHWGTALLQGLPLSVPPPQPPTRSWFSRLFGG